MSAPADPQAPEPSTSLSIGDVVSERYRIDAVLGEGGMGIVYRAEHLHLHKPHALKLLLPEWSSMPEIVARFEREAIAAGNIQSAHVAAATDFGRLPGGSFFLVMEYIDGRTLRAALEAGPLAPTRAVHILRGIVSALHAAHALGIVHRDMKPENVMLIERGGDPDFVKVLDFGIAKVDASAAGPQSLSARAPLTQVGAIIGTPDYMSPEQALGQPVDARSDLYSVGVILFEMLTGSCPFNGGAVTLLRQHVMGDVPELPPATAANVSPRLGGVLRMLLAKHPDNRFASAADLLATLDELRSERTPKAPPVLVVAPATPAPVHATTHFASGLLRLRSLSPKVQLLLALAGLAVVGTLLIALFEGSGVHPSTPEGAASATGSGAAVVSTTPAPPGVLATANTGNAPLTVLPPPPTPSTTTAAAGPPTPAQPASSRGPSRRTGPGGIYIPPPSQWFK